MIEGLGESARLVVTNAERLALGLGNTYIGVEHLFVAIIELEDLGVQRLFSSSGIDSGALAHDLRAQAKSFSCPGSCELLLTRRARNFLESACLAAAGGKEEATAPWLLMAILEDTRALPTRMLASAGFEVDDLARKARLLSRRWVEHGGLRARIENPELASQTGLLDSLGRDLTQDARQGRLHHVIERERELIELMAILMEEGRTSPILLGDAGVGKTAIVEGLALLIAEGKVHPDLRSKEIHTVEVGSIVAGTGIVGKLQEKVQALVKAVERDPDLIVFIDEIHMLVGAGATNAAPDMDVANILKPALSGGRLQCIGSTTLAEYRTSIEADPALARRFGPIQVGEPTPEDALEILTTLRPRYEAFHRLQIEDAALRAAVDLSVRYVLDRRLPAKALDVLNRSCSDKRLRTWLGEFGDLGSLSREERAALLEHAGRAAATAPAVLTADDVAGVVASWTGIPVGRLQEGETARLLKLEELLGERVRGQDEAIAVVAEAIRTSRAGLGDPTKPIGSFLCLGPTGVGKTTLAKVLAEILFDSPDKMVRVDMSEYRNEHDAWKLIGSTAGHVDSDRGGMLTEAVKKNPYSVVLLGEVEKAHPSILDLLLQVLDDGRLSDGLGRTVSFRNTVVIMTSNVGSEDVGTGRVFGFAPEGGTEVDAENMRSDVSAEARRYFPPEFLNRLEEIVVFNPLTKELLREIAHVMVGKLPIRIVIDEAVADFLVEASYDPLWGARPLRRAIRDYIIEPLALQRLRGVVSMDDTIVARLADGHVAFSNVDVGDLDDLQKVDP